MIKLLKTTFKAMWFMAKVAWFCIVFLIIYSLARDYIEELIKKYREKKTRQETEDA